MILDQNKHTKRFGLIGNPIGHSLSPALFNAAYGGKYSYDLIKEAGFKESIARFLSDYDGINVTSPYKRLAFEEADTYDDVVRRIGAANILMKNEDGSITAANSDYAGLRMVLGDHFEIEDHEAGAEKIRTLVIGCGGAGMAAACASADLGMETVIVNRTQTAVERFVSRPGNGNIIPGKMHDLEHLMEESHLIIYTVPVVMEEIRKMPKRFFTGKSIFEANYANPSFSRQFRGLTFSNGLLSLKKDSIWMPQRCYYLSGKVWLLAQAITGFRILTGERPDEAAMLKAASETKKTTDF